MELPDLSAIFGTKEQAPQETAKDAVSEMLALAFEDGVPVVRESNSVEEAFAQFDAIYDWKAAHRPEKQVDDALEVAQFFVDEEAANIFEAVSMFAVAPPPQEEWMAQFELVKESAPRTIHKDVRAKSVTEKPVKTASGGAHNLLARKIANLIQAGDDVDTVVDKCRANLAEGRHEWDMVMKWAGEALHSLSPITSGDIRLAVRNEVVYELELLEVEGDAAQFEDDGYGQNELLTRTGQNAKNIEYWISDDDERLSEPQRAKKAHYIKLRSRPDTDGWVIKVSLGDSPALTIETITGPRNNILADKYLEYCKQMAKRGQWPRRLQDLIDEEGGADYA